MVPGHDCVKSSCWRLDLSAGAFWREEEEKRKIEKNKVEGIGSATCR
jgi:hypothetical protein